MKVEFYSNAPDIRVKLERFPMRWIKYILFILFIGGIAGFLHYTLPQRDVVRITSTDVIRTTPTFWNQYFYSRGDSGNADIAVRDVRLIQGVYPNGEVIVFRNEDTGWFSWPPYFKTNSSDVSAEAENMKSTKEDPQWISVKHYGWRWTPLSVYPNAVRLDPVDGPDVRFIPWFNIFFFIIFGLFALGLVRLWQRFRRRRIDPLLNEIDETVTTRGDRIRGWFKGLGS